MLAFLIRLFKCMNMARSSTKILPNIVFKDVSRIRLSIVFKRIGKTKTVARF